MKKQLLPGMVMLLCLAAGSCRRTVPCSDQFITPAFIGFSYADLDTLLVREYKKGSNFSVLLDIAVIVPTNYALVNGTQHDTVTILLNALQPQQAYIFPDHDWQIVVPAQHVVVKLSDIETEQTDQKCLVFGDCMGCVNPIHTYLQNGQLLVPQVGAIALMGSQGYVAYIRR